MYIRMKQFREMQHMYQSEMAELLNTTQSVISRMEIKGVAELRAPHYKTLCDRFGKETVDAFCTETASVVVRDNINKGTGAQYNGINGTDLSTLEIIKKQAEALASVASKQSEQTDRLLSVLEKLSTKL